MTEIWYNDIASLWKTPLDFFPVRRHGDSDSVFVNRIVRFIIYVTILLFAYKRQFVVFAYGGITIALVSFLFANQSWKLQRHRLEHPRLYCRKPSAQNPYANALSDEFGKGVWPPCEGMEDEKLRLATRHTYHDIDDYPNSEITERQFMTLPNAGYGPDFAGFSKELARGSGIID